MYRLVVLIVFCSVSTLLLGQINLTGTVRDTAGNALEFANVIAYNQNKEAIEWFSITKKDGQYKIGLKKHSRYEITVSYLGMKSLKEPLVTGEKDTVMDFVLSEDLTALEEVVVTRRIPLQISGDTMTYDVETFKNSSDRKLEDVLKRLPGVEVDKDGEVKVEGKRVSKVMIEGKSFFGGGTKLATKNIPAGVLDKIQVLKQHDNVGMLKNVRDNDENVALNLKLKEGKKNFWFGDLTAGAGFDKRYLIHPKLFYYSPKKSINVISDINNVGQAPLSSSDISRFTASYNELYKKSGTDIGVQGGGGPALSVSDNKATHIKSNMAGVNLNYTPANSLDVAGFVLYNGLKKRTENGSIRRYIQDSETPGYEDEILNHETEAEEDFAVFKVKSSYKPNFYKQLDYDISGSFQKGSHLSNTNSSVLDQVLERHGQELFSIRQNLNYYFTLNQDNIFAFESQYLVQKDDPLYNAILERQDLFPYTSELGFREDQENFIPAQEKYIKTNKLDATLNYWHVINRKSNININLGILSVLQDFNSEIYQILDSGEKYNPNPPGSDVFNDTYYKFRDWYMGFLYRLRLGRFTFSAGVTANNYRTHISQFRDTEERTSFGFNPNFSTKIQFKSTEYMYLNYARRSTFPNIGSLANGMVLNGYSNLYRGNSQLLNSIMDNYGVNYTNSINLISRKRFTIFNLAANYGRVTDGYRSSMIPDGVFNESTTINSIYQDENISVLGKVDKALWYVKATVSASFAQSSYNQLVNGEQSKNESFVQSYNYKLSSNFFNKDYLGFELGYRITFSDYDMGMVATEFRTENPYVNLTSTIGAFDMKADYAFYNYKTQGASISKYDLLNASIIYNKRGSSWEYTLTAKNLLNTKRIIQDQFSEFYTSSTAYSVLPRYVYLTITYTL